jgi:hypothetical protein
VGFGKLTLVAEHKHALWHTSITTFSLWSFGQRLVCVSPFSLLVNITGQVPTRL